MCGQDNGAFICFWTFTTNNYALGGTKEGIIEEGLIQPLGRNFFYHSQNPPLVLRSKGLRSMGSYDRANTRWTLHVLYSNHLHFRPLLSWQRVWQNWFLRALIYCSMCTFTPCEGSWVFYTAVYMWLPVKYFLPAILTMQLGAWVCSVPHRLLRYNRINASNSCLHTFAIAYLPSWQIFDVSFNSNGAP